MKPYEVLDRLRKGEEVLCEMCREGVLKPVGDTKCDTTLCFVCDCCAAEINID